jgi:hemolysin III
VIKTYPPAEERINILSHSVGLAASVAGLFLLVHRALGYGSPLYLFSFTVFGLSLVTLYTASTVYHRSKQPEIRLRMRVVDHASIYLLIAGTYTPFTLITLAGPAGYTIFTVTWLMAVAGVVLKLFYTGRFSALSTAMYVFMGWLIVFAIKPLVANLPPAGLHWLVGGGIAYTVGAIIYGIKSLPFNHATFHLFVMLGSLSHFIAIYVYVRPV